MPPLSWLLLLLRKPKEAPLTYLLYRKEKELTMAVPVPLQKPRNTYDAKDIVRDFHRELPSDRRYNSSTILKFVPTTVVSQDPDRRNPIIFSIPAHTTGGVYMVQDMVLMVNLVLRKLDKTQIPQHDIVSVSNNVVNSLFKNIYIEINEERINKKTTPGHHAYKSYVSRLLTFDDEVKQTQEDMGWASDTPDNFDTMDKRNNTGFQDRSKWFWDPQAKKDQEWVYSKKPVQFVSTVDHDLASLATGIPPATKIEFTFEQTSDEFRILSESATAKYNLEIQDIAMLLPVRVLAQNLWKDLQLSMQKRPVTLNIRVMDVQQFTCHAGVKDFDQRDLWKQIPTKVIVGIVRYNAFSGKENLNPFK